MDRPCCVSQFPQHDPSQSNLSEYESTKFGLFLAATKRLGEYIRSLAKGDAVTVTAHTHASIDYSTTN